MSFFNLISDITVVWLWVDFHFPIRLNFFFFFSRVNIEESRCWLVVRGEGWFHSWKSSRQPGSSSGEGGSGGGMGSSSYLLNKKTKTKKTNMSTGASWQTLLACLAASYSFGTVFWMNVNLLKKVPKRSWNRRPVSFCLNLMWRVFLYSFFWFNSKINISFIY